MKLDPVAFVLKAHNNSVLNKVIKTFGNTEKLEKTMGSVSKIGFGKLNLTESLMPIGKSRPGKKAESIEFIVVHDTGNNNIGANAKLHAKYLQNDPGVSWHYTVDEEGAYHNIPDDEIGYHAGDGLRDFGLTDTFIKASTNKPSIEIIEGKYVINGIKTEIEAPMAEDRLGISEDITPMGIYTEIGENGNYYINNTYYNKGYKLISNAGGGTRGIGIESCVNEGGSLFSTWQNLAKLVAKLLVENNLGLNRVMQHNHFSGKNCPQTLRMSDSWEMFMEMVETEYDMLTTYKDYSFRLIENKNLDKFGKVINEDIDKIDYKVKITNNNGYLEEVNLESKIR